MSHERWNISVHQNVRASSAMWVAIAPGRPVLDERQRSGPVQGRIDPGELVRDAVASCPSEAISAVNADGGQALINGAAARTARRAASGTGPIPGALVRSQGAGIKPIMANANISTRDVPRPPGPRWPRAV
jgi:hypothetical protein